MRTQSLFRVIIFLAFFLFTSLIISSEDLLANQQASPGEEMIWTTWDPTQRALIDDGDILWIGTDSGLVRFDKASGEHTHISNVEGLPQREIHTGLVDQAGVRWFGGDAGLSKLTVDGQWSHFDTSSGLFTDFVDGIAMGSSGDIWLKHGAEPQISHRRPDGSWQVLSSSAEAVVQEYTAVKETMNPNELWAISGNEVWVGYEVYDGVTWENRKPDKASEDDPDGLMADSKGTIWAFEGDQVFGWDGQKWSEYWIDLADGYLSTMAIDANDDVWIGGKYFSAEYWWAVYEYNVLAHLPEEPGEIEVDRSLSGDSRIIALLPKEEGLWGIGYDWLLKADGATVSLNDMPWFINEVIVDRAGSTWLNSIDSSYSIWPAGYMEEFDDRGTGTMNDDKIYEVFWVETFPTTLYAVEVAENGDFWLTGVEKGRYETPVPPRRHHRGDFIDYQVSEAYPTVYDIFAEDGQHTWFAYTEYDYDQGNYVPGISRLDDGGTPADFKDDLWTEYAAPASVATSYDSHFLVAKGNGRLWYGDSTGVYLDRGQGWQLITEDKPYDLIPAADDTLFVNVGADQVLVVEPDGRQYQQSVTELVEKQPLRVGSTSRRNPMWSVAPDGAIWYWGVDDQLIRQQDGQINSYEAPVGRSTIGVDLNNHVWLAFEGDLWRLSPKPDFDIASGPQTWFIKAEEKRSGSISVVDISGYPESVTLEVSDLPLGVTAEITPEIVEAGETAGLTLNSHGMALGEYAFKISGASGETTRSRLVKLYVVEEVHEMSLPVVGKGY